LNKLLGFNDFNEKHELIFVISSRESWELTLIVYVNIDIIVNIISSGKLGAELGVCNSDNVVLINVLGLSPVTGRIKVSLISPRKLSLEQIKMFLLNWVDSAKDIPVNRLTARRGGH
jgi:hypothetical protein